MNTPLGVLIAQDLNGTPTVAEPEAGSGTPPNPVDNPPPTPVDVPVAPVPGGPSQSLCEAADRQLKITVAAYDVSALIVALALFAILKKKVWSNFTARAAVAVTFAAVASATLVLLDPAKTDDLVRCINSSEYVQYVTLGKSALARAAALGFLPTLLGTLLGCFAVHRL